MRIVKLLTFGSALGLAFAFQVKTDVPVTRRAIFEKGVVSVLGVASATLLPKHPASASGGATAGGAYLLSAKQRYNERVSKGVVSFMALSASLESGDIDTLRIFFSTDDVGGWKDFSSAGYLLANAFRRSSSTPPDNLPSVQKWKAFAAQVEDMTKALKKKDTSKASSILGTATSALDAYLEQVELPPAKEIS